ncbi:hypothetical protein I4F81_008114 [Pyropia yezoensis]|uniref:Uncharacterized protein n=1 Tax=Pyropia yezoensis TaxID=2788 RepID=A0ACC3C633_PYRYE|nr:hypothetical protein I4F81_008114 [Neopyropia yezoensis]
MVAFAGLAPVLGGRPRAATAAAAAASKGSAGAWGVTARPASAGRATAIPTRRSAAAHWTAVATPPAPSSTSTGNGVGVAAAAAAAAQASTLEDDAWLRTGSRQSKIVCTIGPKTSDVESIAALAAAGMNVARLNMSHGTHEWHAGVIANVRTVNARGGVNIGLLLDTKGPEVRSGDLKAPIEVERGQAFTWTVRRDLTDLPPFTTDVSYDDFVKDVHVGDTLLVDGGMCSFLVTSVDGPDVLTECIDGGTLTSRRHLNVRGKSASLPAITDKDWEDIRFGMEQGVDFYALSFVKHENDVAELKAHMLDAGVQALVLSKIESADAVGRLPQILAASDGAMVARGDLGAEIPVEDVPLVQDEIVRLNRLLRKPTIVATHMLESMISYPTPTRAEVTDITEAVKQGADATMLSGETANGAYPLRALGVMNTVAEADAVRDAGDGRVDLAFAASTLATRLDATALVVFTRVGNYARLVSSTRPRCPIIALCPDAALMRRMSLLWGVSAFVIDFSDDPEVTISRAMDLLRRRGLAASKDTLVICSDMLVDGGGDADAVNTLQVRRMQ